jgi:hypothetical protein
MTTNLGNWDLKNISIPTAWDAAELKRLQLRDGTGFEGLLRDIDDALGMVNAELQSGYLANLFSLTQEPAVEYRNGATTGFEEHTEYTQPDAQRGDTSGHMLPLVKKDRKLGWTYDFLKEARRPQLDADIASLVQDAKDAFEKAVLTRLFKMEEETGKRYGLGSSGYSVPFVDGAAGTIDWTPVANPARTINTMDTTHDHYLRLNGITQANLETALGHLWEHGADGPYELIVPLADLGSWQNTTNVTGFKPTADPLIQYGTTTSLANVAANMYQGAITTKYGVCRLYANGRIPTTKWAVTKTYGANDQRNPLRVRWDEVWGFGVQLISESVSLYPLKGAIGMLAMGVGVGEDRAAAVLVENDSAGDYATPTIS